VAVGRFSGLATNVRDDVPHFFASVTDTAVRRTLETANAGAVAALEKAAAWFTAEEKRGTDAYALGPELFSEMLRMTEGVNEPLDSLEAQGRRDLDRNLTALREACGKFAPGVSVAACVDRMNAHKSTLSLVETPRPQPDTPQAFA